MNFQAISPEEWNDNLFRRLDKDWMLITAGNADDCNTMTASWGGFGILWHKPVATVYIRPARHTFSYVEREDTFSLCFFPPEYHEALAFCGTKSGRDTDKFAATGLTPVFSWEAPAVAEADTVIICRKRYADDIRPACFSLGDAKEIYPQSDFHRFYIGEILGVYRRLPND